MTGDLYPDMPAESAHLEHSRRCRLYMITDYKRVLADPNAADDLTREYVAMMAELALANLADPASAEFFGRIDNEDAECFHIGRRHIDNVEHDHVVVDWRAPIAAPFYRATVSDSYGLRLRRRFTLRDSSIVAYNDERLDDPEAADIAGGIPDPVLAEIGAARTGAMREIVATIQAEQDVVIRTPLSSCLVVQGGPGTGKTAVGLHRAAFLMFEHRVLMAREGVLVVGPNRVFLDYIGNVLPSLGERSVDQRMLADIVLPRIVVDGVDDADVAERKGALIMTKHIEALAYERIRTPTSDTRASLGVRSYTFTPDDWAGWIAAAKAGSTPLNRRREGFRALVRQELSRRTGKDNPVASAPAVKAAMDKAWPVVKPLDLVKQLRREEFGATTKTPWTSSDAVLLDEANSFLNGPPRTYAHIVVDEAQDLTPLALRVIARRCPSRSITLLGDLAQSTAPGGQSNWSDALVALDAPADARIEHLTIGYRVPAPILEVANRFLARAGVDVPPSRSARLDGKPPDVRVTPNLAAVAVDSVAELVRRHRLSGIITPLERRADIVMELTVRGLRPVEHLHDLADDEVPVIIATEAKGLELDGVVIAEPEAIFDGTKRGAKLLYIALTRAVQELVVVTTDATIIALT